MDSCDDMHVSYSGERDILATTLKLKHQGSSQMSCSDKDEVVKREASSELWLLSGNSAIMFHCLEVSCQQ